MKRLNLFLILAVTLCIAAGCEKGNTNGGSLRIDAKVVNGNEYHDLIDVVKVVTSHDAFDVLQTEIIACTYSNGGFSATLPKKIIESAYSFVMNGNTVMTNDIYANFYAYKNGERVGKFVYCSADSKYVVQYY